MRRLLLLFILAGFHLSYAQEYPEMVRIEGGTFKMGDELHVGDSMEQPVHNVTLKPYYIAKTETTVLQWKIYCQAIGEPMPAYTTNGGQTDNHPVSHISWYKAMRYCAWLGKKYGKNYRLPTEAEWEYAARGGNKNKSRKYSNDASQILPKRANELGLYDLTGNLKEWCYDWFDIYPAKPAINPTGPETGVYRVLRGGARKGNTFYRRIVLRSFANPGAVADDTGFRVVTE